MFIKEFVQEKIIKAYNYCKNQLLFTPTLRIVMIVSALYYIINNVIIWYKIAPVKPNIQKTI